MNIQKFILQRQSNCVASPRTADRHRRVNRRQSGQQSRNNLAHLAHLDPLRYENDTHSAMRY